MQAPQKYLDRFPNIADEKRRLFAAMLSAQDDAIGRVLGKIREMGQEENTLIFYIADNVFNLDVFPTMVVAAGGRISDADRLDGVDLAPFFTGASKSRPHETMYWRFGEQWAIRHGDLKLVKSRGGSGEPELYDLAADFSESKNLAASRPEDVKKF